MTHNGIGVYSIKQIDEIYLPESVKNVENKVDQVVAVQESNEETLEVGSRSYKWYKDGELVENIKLYTTKNKTPVFDKIYEAKNYLINSFIPLIIQSYIL